MKLWEAAIKPAERQRETERSFGVNDYINWLSDPSKLIQSWGAQGNEEIPSASFESYAEMAFKADPVVYRAESFRKAVFSQARFQWRQRTDRNVFGNPELQILERPWPGGNTAKLLGRMLLHADLGGNAYVLRVSRTKLALLRPDWVTIVMSDDPATALVPPDIIGYQYTPGGQAGDSVMYLPEEVAHFAPMPDPVSQYRGMSWLTPVIREIQGDKAATEHKIKFFEQGATPNMVIKFDPTISPEKVKAFKELLDSEHQGVRDAYKTMYLGGGADATVVGADFQQLDFKSTQGKGETRILMAAGVHAVLAGASEGMQGSSLNAGNYSQVRRNFSDVDLQDLFNEAASSLEVLLRVPAGAELMVDGRHIPFLQQDKRDTAEIQQNQANSIVALVRDGFTPESAVMAIKTDDFSVLRHTGMTSVQLQEPGAQQDAPPQGDDDD
ncbi:MAG: phage portal protein [Nitriliruptor sp.]|nr:MAG: phage portal protein [Nitriliruptor sp.]